MERTTKRRGLTALSVTCAAAAVVTATPAYATPPPAEKIVMERSGGFAGNRDTFLVDRSTVGGRGVLRVAGSAQFRSLRRSYQPKNPCCDRYTYRLTVTYRHGWPKTVTTVQGATAPRVLWYTIGEVERVGQQTSERLTRGIA
jgi:hypothetical protein